MAPPLPNKEPELERKDEKPYKIQLPGFQDVIRVPALEDKKLRHERYRRFLDSKTIIPEPLRWIPGVVAFLDDCQDLLITGLVLARPLLKKLPARFVPYLGWILLANDIANLSTGLLGAALGGRSFKRASFDAAAMLVTRRGFLLKRGEDFLKNGIPWLSAVLQGGQALETVTGYGVALGGVMGFITGSFWGSLRYLAGQDITLEGVPKNDILGKCFRVLSQRWTMPNLRNILSDAEYSVVMAGQALASAIWTETYQPGSVVLDYKTIKGDKVPKPDDRFRGDFIQWIGGQPDYVAGQTVGGGYPTPIPGDLPTIEDAHISAAKNMWLLEEHLGENTSETIHGSTLGLLYNQMGREALNWSVPNGLLDKPIFRPGEIDHFRAIEYAIRLPEGTPKKVTQEWLARARKISEGRGLNAASFEDMKQAARDMGLSYQRFPFQTFVPQP